MRAAWRRCRGEERQQVGGRMASGSRTSRRPGARTAGRLAERGGADGRGEVRGLMLALIVEFCGMVAALIAEVC